MSPPRLRPWPVAHPHVPGSDHVCPGSGSRPPPSSWPRPWQGPPGTGAQLASYSGLTPVTHRSGSSIHGEHVSHGGNKRLERAMFPSASLRSEPISRTYYQRKRNQGKPRWTKLPRPAPPPHHGPARHDPQHPPTSHETTHRRLTHHIGAPPCDLQSRTSSKPPHRLSFCWSTSNRSKRVHKGQLRRRERPILHHRNRHGLRRSHRSAIKRTTRTVLLYFSRSRGNKVRQPSTSLRGYSLLVSGRRSYDWKKLQSSPLLQLTRAHPEAFI